MINLIRQIIEQKRQASRVPAHALFYKDILPQADSRAEARQELNNLVKAGKIGFGRTINDTYFYEINDTAKQISQN